MIYKLLLTLIAVGFTGCKMLPEYKEDNIVEEIFEDVIEHHSGIDIDLTPSSKELNDHASECKSK